MANSWVNLLAELEKQARERLGLAKPAKQTEEKKKIGEYKKGDLLLETYAVETDAIRGGMGSVWRVHHTGWDVDLAMKRPQEEKFQTEKQKEMFIRECESWVNLGLHPNIVSCYYVREVDDVPTIFSEWMTNGSLKDHIRDGSLYEGSESEVRERLWDIMIQFARGLRYAHSQGLIHQDVKPDNLLINEDWCAKVADFGISRARAVCTLIEKMDTIPDNGMTVTAPSGGYTPAYCSMEQMDGKTLTRRTDIYSWAVSIMEMYTGERSWQNGVVAGMACDTFLQDCRIEMPEELRMLLKKCMDSEPDNRPHSFDEIEEQLTAMYMRVFDHPYARAVPVTPQDTAESLNNRALSFLDIGKTAEAERLWNRVLADNPNHVESIYNRGLYLWRSGQLEDRPFLEMLNQHKQNGGQFSMLIEYVKRESGSSRRIAVESFADFAPVEFEFGNLEWLSADRCRGVVRIKDNHFGIIDVKERKALWDYQTVYGKTRYAISRNGNAAVFAVSIEYALHVDVFRKDERVISVEIPSQGQYACTAAVSDDGSCAYIGLDDGKLVVVSDWGKEIRIISTEANQILCIALNEEEKLLTIGGDGHSKYLQVLSTDNLETKAKLSGDRGSTRSVFQKENRVISFGPNNIKIWDISRQRCLHSILPDDYPDMGWIQKGWINKYGSICAINGDEVCCFSYQEDDFKAPFALNRIQTAESRGESDNLFDHLCQQAELYISRGENRKALSYLEQARRIEGYEKNLRILNLNDQAGKGLKKIGIRDIYQRFTCEELRADFSSETRSVFGYSRNSTDLCKYSIDTGEKIKTEFNTTSKAVICVGKGFVAGIRGKYIYILDTESCREICKLEFPEVVYSDKLIALKYNEQKEILMCGCDNGYIRLWSTKNWEPITVFNTRQETSTSFDMNDEGTMILAAGNGRELIVYEIESHIRVIDREIPRSDYLRDIDKAAFIGEEVLILSGTDYVTDRYGDLIEFKNIQKVSLEDGSVITMDVAASSNNMVPSSDYMAAVPGSRWCIAGKWDQSDAVFFTVDGSAGERSFELFRSKKSLFVERYHFTADGRYLVASGRYDYRIKVYETNLWEVDWIYE